MFLLWITVSSWQMRQALRWWFRQEAIDRATQADHIQNGLIQDLFAVRLSLQSPLSEQSEERTQQQQIWVAAAEKLHERLSHLSHTLIQPYLAESLPLAIRSLLKQWETVYPDRSLQLDLPASWHSEPLERSQIILTTLQTLLKFAVPASLPNAALEIALLDRSPQAMLTVKITYPNAAARRAITRVRELKYLCRCFRSLAPGACFYQAQSSAAVWRFHWKP